MSQILTTDDMATAMKKLQDQFGGSVMEDMKKGGVIAWMSKLGYSNLFTDPEDPKEWLDWMLTGIDKNEKFDKEKYVPKTLRAHVLTMVFAYSNYLVRTCSDILAEKDVEISFRNDYIFKHTDFKEFMKLHEAAFKK